MEKKIVLFKNWRIKTAWVVMPPQDSHNTDEYKQYPNFKTLKEADAYCKENNFKVISITPVSYELRNKILSVYLGEYKDATYSYVNSIKRAGELLFEDYGVEL